jgi:hypothetical protein
MRGVLPITGSTTWGPTACSEAISIMVRDSLVGARQGRVVTNAARAPVSLATQ